MIGFIHVGKTGGTAIKSLLSQHKERTPNTEIRAFGHDMNLPRFFRQWPDGRAVFFVRDPISRFVSSFNSRLRCGRPRYDIPWSTDEAEAFASFSRPTDLAEALSSDDASMQIAANRAMQAVFHLSVGLASYLGTVSFLEAHKSSILFVGTQETFEKDVAALKQLLLVDDDIECASDEIGAHRTPPGMDKTVSALGASNLKERLRKDYDLYRWCLGLRVEILRYSIGLPVNEAIGTGNINGSVGV